MPARATASSGRAALARSSVNGFSMKTCLPAAAACSTCFPCSLCGVANTTASISGSARISSRLSLSAMPCSAQNAAAFDAVRVCPAVKRKAVLCPCTPPTSVRPHRPIPTIAARIIAFPLSPQFPWSVAVHDVAYAPLQPPQRREQFAFPVQRQKNIVDARLQLRDLLFELLNRFPLLV